MAAFARYTRHGMKKENGWTDTLSTASSGSICSHCPQDRREAKRKDLLR